MGKTTSYLWKIFSETFEIVRNDLGTKGVGLILALKISLTAISVALIVLLGLTRANEPVYTIVFNIFIGDICTLIVLWLATPFIAFLRMSETSAIRDAEQKEKIKLLTEVIKLQFVPDISPDAQNFFVEILNPNVQKIVNLRIKLVQNGLSKFPMKEEYRK